MSKIAIVVGHARRETFCEAIGTAYQNGATQSGHEARLFVTSKMNFDAVLREGFTRLQPLEPDLQAAHDAMLWADHLVFIFPLWMGTLPAIFKGFIERILQPELLSSAKTGTFAKPLKGKSARIIVTMGMPGFIYRWYFGAFAVRMMKRNILGFVGVRPVRTTIYGSVEAVAREKREEWLHDVEAMGRAAC